MKSRVVRGVSLLQKHRLKIVGAAFALPYAMYFFWVMGLAGPAERSHEPLLAVLGVFRAIADYCGFPN